MADTAAGNDCGGMCGPVFLCVTHKPHWHPARADRATPLAIAVTQSKSRGQATLKLNVLFASIAAALLLSTTAYASDQQPAATGAAQQTTDNGTTPAPGGVFSDDFIDAYIELKMRDVTAFRASTHPLEFQLYYGL